MTYTVAPVEKMNSANPIPSKHVPTTTPAYYSAEDFDEAKSVKDKQKLKEYKKVFAKANAAKARPKSTKVPSKPNPWNKHVREFRLEHPHLSFKEVLEKAKLTYHKKTDDTVVKQEVMSQ